MPPGPERGASGEAPGPLEKSFARPRPVCAIELARPTIAGTLNFCVSGVPSALTPPLGPTFEKIPAGAEREPAPAGVAPPVGGLMPKSAPRGWMLPGLALGAGMVIGT